MSFMRLLRTISRLKFRQILYLMRYRLISYKFRERYPEAEERGISLKTDFLNTENSFFPVEKDGIIGKFTFVGKSKSIDSWYPEEELLWLFNLHYFEYLNQPDMTYSRGINLIYNWKKNCEKSGVSKNISHHPYVASLRLMNWLKFMQRFDEYEKDIMQIIYAHIVMVKDNLEYDIDGNHLLTNLCAIRFGLQFFTGYHPDLLKKKIHKKLSSALKEQIKNDGGHCERSFMYHSLILEMLIDIENAGCKEYDSYIVKMSEYLRSFTYNTGEIPLFNDAACGVSRKPDDLICYAEKCSAFKKQLPGNKKGAEIFTGTNFAVLKKENWLIHFDGGGAFSRQPGHAHSSALSFELYRKGKKVITDPGCFTYREGNMRRYLRSTSSHNALAVDGKNQDEIWGAFRMGGRAEHFPLEISEKTVTGRLKTCYGAIQKRSISVSGDHMVKIHDIVEFPGNHEAVIRYLILDSSLKVVSPELLESSTEKNSYFKFFNMGTSALQMEFRKNFTKSVSITTIISI